LFLFFANPPPPPPSFRGRICEAIMATHKSEFPFHFWGVSHFFPDSQSVKKGYPHSFGCQEHPHSFPWCPPFFSVLLFFSTRGHIQVADINRHSPNSRVNPPAPPTSFFVHVSPLVPPLVLSTGWRLLIGSPKLQVIFHKRATKYRSLLRKMTYKDTGSYESSPPCIRGRIRGADINRDNHAIHNSQCSFFCLLLSFPLPTFWGFPLFFPWHPPCCPVHVSPSFLVLCLVLEAAFKGLTLTES